MSNSMIKKINKPSDKTKLYLWHPKFHNYVLFRHSNFINLTKLSIGNTKYWDYLHEFIVNNTTHDKKSLEVFIDLKKDTEIFSNVFVNELLLYYDKADYEQFDSIAINKVIFTMESIIFEKTFEYYKNLEDPEVLLNFIESFNITKYNINKKDSIIDTTLNFDDTDSIKSLSKAMEAKYKSILPGIHKAFGSNEGYLPNSLIMIVAPTGVGKSLFLLQNSGNLVKQNSKHLFISVGADLTKAHILTRLLQQFTKKTELELRSYKLNEALEQYKSYEFINEFSSLYLSYGLNYAVNNLKTKDIDKKLKDEFLNSFGLDIALNDFKQSGFSELFNKDNYGLLILPPDEVSGAELVKKLIFEGYVTKYDTFSIDYDGHFAKPNNQLDMYNAGGALYAQLTKLTAINSNIVFIGCQTNKINYNKEIIGLDSIVESSKKQHIVSCVITISKHDVLQTDKLQIGKINIAKARHGQLTSFYYLRDQYLNFRQINKNQYNMLIQASKQYLDSLIEQGDFLYLNKNLEEVI